MSDGRSIVTTKDHFFFSDCGYVPLRQLRPGDSLLGYDSSLLQSNLELFPSIHVEDVRHYFEITEDSQVDYHHLYHLYGERPHSEVKTDEHQFQLLNGAHERTLHGLHKDDLDTVPRHNHSYLPSFHLSSHDVFLQVGRRASRAREYYSLADKDAFAHCLQGHSILLQSQDNFFPERLTDEFDLNVGQELIFSSWVQSPYLSIITLIEDLGKGDFYDLHVPIYNNYLAEGLIHHNSGKTAYIAVSLAAMAAMFPGFRGFAVAPQMIQALEVYKFLDRLTYNTPWHTRWVTRQSEHHRPGFVLENDYIGKSEITILSIEDDPEKVRTVEGDVVFLDQAEKIQGLDGVIRDLGTRTRGMVAGRPRIGRLALIANSDNNPELWYRYDLGLLQPDNYLSLTVKSKDNYALSPKDIENFKRRVGGDAQSEKQWLEGERPIGSGEHFSAEMITRCTDRGLNATMDAIIDQRPTLNSNDARLEWMSGFIKEEEPRAGIYHWEMPPDIFAKRQYIVIADPGSGNPPFRNAACTMVWDITDFPRGPMTLQSFHWIHGNGQYTPFIDEYVRLIQVYNAFGRNAFDSTGIQKGFNELVFEQITLDNDARLMAEGMDMNGVNGKYPSLNALKTFMSRGYIKFPYLGALNLQLSNYTLPDSDIPQDIVMTMAMSAQFVRQYYWTEKDDDDAVRSQIKLLPKGGPREIRYPRSKTNRFSR